MPRLIIFANGPIPDLESARRVLRPNDVIYAADGGSRHALALGLFPSCVIGDLDSLPQDDRWKLEAGGVEVRPFPRDKDMTDLELAIQYGLQAGYREILILGGLGGRIDHSLGNLSLLTGLALEALDIRMDDGVEQAFFTRGSCEVHGRPGDIVSLIPWGGQVTGRYHLGTALAPAQRDTFPGPDAWHQQRIGRNKSLHPFKIRSAPYHPSASKIDQQVHL